MTIHRILVRIIAPLCVFVLAACQTTPSTETDTAAAGPATVPQTAEEAIPESPPTEQASEQGAPVAVFLASSDAREGWQPVQLDVGSLYLNPQPVVIRDDLTGVQAGTSEDGDGLLALELSPNAQNRLAQATTENPNLRLALIVGRTLLAAPGYDRPVTTQHLVFVVGTEQNALSAARAIAGVPADGSGDDQSRPGDMFNDSGATGGSAPSAPSSSQ